MDQPDSSATAQQARMQTAIYRQLQEIARIHLSKEQRPVTISPASLSHEAWLKLQDHEGFSREPLKQEFLALAGAAMRQILIDRARARLARKRIPREAMEPLTGQHLAPRQQVTCGQLLQLDTALKKLCRLDPDMEQVVVLRYFGGCSIAQTARVMHRSERAVSRLWTAARAWLHRELS